MLWGKTICVLFSQYMQNSCGPCMSILDFFLFFNKSNPPLRIHGMHDRILGYEDSRIGQKTNILAGIWPAFGGSSSLIISNYLES